MGGDYKRAGKPMIWHVNVFRQRMGIYQNVVRQRTGMFTQTLSYSEDKR